MNRTLDNAIEKAGAESTPNDNIESTIQRGGGGAEGEQYEGVAYERCGSTPRALQKDAADTLVLSRVGGMGQRPGYPPCRTLTWPRRGWLWPPPTACHARHSVRWVAIPDHAMGNRARSGD